MTDKRMTLDAEQLEQVVGGLFVFHKKSKYITFTHQDGTVTNHNTLDYDKAWEQCMTLEAKNWDEDKIFQNLIDNGYIDPSER